LIPPSILANAHGLMFIRLYRGGFMVSAKKGTGVIIARLPDGSWSAPSGISMGALGFGHQAGVEVIDSIIVMNYRGAVKAFFDGGGQMQLGASMSISAGPLGRAADVAASTANGQHISATYAYSSSKGLFAGYSFEGSKISERVNTNAAFYGRNINAREILTGGVARPPQAQRLYDMLTSLGAGPRPGLPFAPKKGRMSMPPPQQQQHPSFYNNQQHPSQGSFHQPQSPYQSTPPPPQQFNNNPPGMGGAAMEQMTVVIAKYDFNGEQPGDLTFSAGDHIIVTQRKGDRQAWWEGEIGSRKGMFPANYTEDMS
ncbi:hypothetical protein BDA99DRAFT_428789, partial [Phascolomyces articulosus]